MGKVTIKIMPYSFGFYCKQKGFCIGNNKTRDRYIKTTKQQEEYFSIHNNQTVIFFDKK